MSEGTPDTAPVNGEAEAPTGDAAAAAAPKTAEEVEAFWKHRQSQTDRAHAAETAELQRQLEAAKKAPVAPSEGESPEAARVRELEAALAAERTARQAIELQSQYPLTARVLGESMANLPPEKLAAAEAGFEAAAEAGVPPRIDPNAAPRTTPGMPGPGTKPVNEKSKDELLADLRRIAPAYQEAAREGLL